MVAFSFGQEQSLRHIFRAWSMPDCLGGREVDPRSKHQRHGYREVRLPAELLLLLWRMQRRNIYVCSYGGAATHAM